MKKIYYVTFASYPYFGNTPNLRLPSLNSGYIPADENSQLTPEHIEEWVNQYGLFRNIDLTGPMKPSEKTLNKVISWSEVVNYSSEEINEQTD